MFKIQTSKKYKLIALGLLILLNIVLRIPSIPHAKGRDSFFIHALANSINSFGEARWWDHWLSVFGYYPYSYASGLPFTLSGISQLIGIDVEKAALVYSILFGVLTIFFVFIIAGLIYDDFLFKYIMAFFFSLSPGIMLFTTWEASSRGLFMVFLPLLLFVLLKSYPLHKKVLLSVFTLISIYSFHHYAIFAVVFTIGYLSLRVLFVLDSRYHIFSSVKISPKSVNYVYLVILFSAFMYPFLTQSMITAGSRYSWIISIIVTNVRFIGPAAFIAIGGLISLALSERKSFIHWFFLISFIFILPFIYNLTYGVYLLLFFFVMFLGIGFKSVIATSSVSPNASKIIGIFIICILVLSTLFTGYYNHYRTGERQFLWYMDDRSYEFGHWVNEEISKDNRVLMITDHNYFIHAVSMQEGGLSILIGETIGRAYGLIDDTYTKSLVKVSPTSMHFYDEAVYATEYRDIYKSVEWYLLAKDVYAIKQVYDLDYIVQSSSSPRRVEGLSGQNAEIVYTNGIHEIYNLRTT